MAANCAEAIAYRVQSKCSGAFQAMAYSTFDPQRPVTGRPYASQAAKYRLFTDKEVRLGDRINGGRVVSVERPCEGRVFCDVLHFELINPVTVDLYEVTRIEGPRARSVRKIRGSVQAGRMDVGEGVRTEDERKIESGRTVWVLCDRVEDLIADRWLLHVDGCDFKVKRIDDLDRLDGLPLVITEKEKVRR